MEQVILVTSGNKAESKSFTSTGLFTMNSAVGGQDKTENKQSGKKEEDTNVAVPFLQLLNQQISQTNKSSDTIASNVNEEETSFGKTIILQGDVALNELPQGLANLTSFGNAAGADPKQNGQESFSSNDLLKEIDLLKNNLSPDNIQTGSNAEADISSILAGSLSSMAANSENGRGIKDDSTNMLKSLLGSMTSREDNKQIISNENVLLSQVDPITLRDSENKLSSVSGSSPTPQVSNAAMDLKNVTGALAKKDVVDNMNLQSQLENSSAEKIFKFAVQGLDKQSVSQNDERILQPERRFFLADQLAAITAVGKSSVNSAVGKEEKKISENILPLESNIEDSTSNSNPRLSAQEIKDSMAGNKNILIDEKQYSTNARAKSGNETNAEPLTTILSEVSVNTKTSQKSTVAVNEKVTEENSINSVNGVGSVLSNTGKNDVLPDKIIGQVASEIREVAASNGGRVKITLNPPSLGKLEMDVTVRNGKVEVVLVAENKDVQQALNTHIDQLKGSLQNQGLTIDRCDVFMQDKREEYQQSFSQQAYYHQNGSGQNNNSRQEKQEGEIKDDKIISERPGNVLRVSTDNISLFA